MSRRYLAQLTDLGSSIPGWLSDALCRLATGGGFATRMLYTDRDEMIFEAQRPVVLNGIPFLANRADLADRAVTIHLRAIPEEERQPEDALWEQFEHARPRILGALLDAVSAALRHLSKVRIARPPRMADFVKWITAAEPGLGWDDGAFLTAYRENRRNISESAFEGDGVAVAIRDFVTTVHPDGWQGTPTQLLTELNQRTAEGIRKARSWPLTAQALGNRVERIAPLLRSQGFVVDRNRSAARSSSYRPEITDLRGYAFPDIRHRSRDLGSSHAISLGGACSLSGRFRCMEPRDVTAVSTAMRRLATAAASSETPVVIDFATASTAPFSSEK